MKNIRLYNTLTRKTEEFSPVYEGEMRMYHCGPTVYWVQHIGNMRGMVVGDFIRRTFEYAGYNTQYVRNYTDFGHLVSDEDFGEDKIEKRAEIEGTTAKEVAQKYIKMFDDDVAALNMMPATKGTVATEYIQEMIDIIKGLLDSGHAYKTDEAIYFDVSQAKDYTALSRQKLENMIEGAGVGGHKDEGKKSPADFVLWFFRTGSHENTALYWPSPFGSPLVENGEGTPGWHIECSAMSMAELGETLDIHMGGIEHIPIHHPNEIAQSQAYTGKTFTKYWLHNEHLTVDGGKMSKSEGTSYTLADVLEKGYESMDLRYFFAQAHYRSKQNFTWKALEASRVARRRLMKKVDSIRSEGGSLAAEYVERFDEAILNEVNTSVALSVLIEMVGDEKLSKEDRYATALSFDIVFGLQLDQESIVSDDVSVEVTELLTKRDAAKEAKEYETSDSIREDIEKLGYLVLDTPDGQKVEKK